MKLVIEQEAKKIIGYKNEKTRRNGITRDTEKC